MDIIPHNFDYFNNPVISKKQFDTHIKLYKGYISKTNEVANALNNKEEADRNDANATYSKYRGLKKAETYAIDGVLFHELYFENIGAEKSSPKPKTMEIFEHIFGSFENFKKDFIACAKASRGWVTFAFEQRTNSFINILQDLHNEGVICMAYPLLVLDMYEHAYYIDYGSDKEKYINNFFESINWDMVEKRMEKILE